MSSSGRLDGVSALIVLLGLFIEVEIGTLVSLDTGGADEVEGSGVSD